MEKTNICKLKLICSVAGNISNYHFPHNSAIKSGDLCLISSFSLLCAFFTHFIYCWLTTLGRMLWKKKQSKAFYSFILATWKRNEKNKSNRNGILRRKKKLFKTSVVFEKSEQENDHNSFGVVVFDRLLKQKVSVSPVFKMKFAVASWRLLVIGDLNLFASQRGQTIKYIKRVSVASSHTNQALWQELWCAFLSPNLPSFKQQRNASCCYCCYLLCIRMHGI